VVTSRSSSSGRHCAVEFQALPARIGHVRRLVAAQLRHWELDPLVDCCALAVTELLANVHEHAGPDKRCTVELVLLEDRLTVSVRDHDPRLPQLRDRELLATGGRGLALVAALSEGWGVSTAPDGTGKAVWFALPLPDAPARAGEEHRAVSDGAAADVALRPRPMPA
jgi:anti-sigma regulatory factor (Ser/Thr protein kinase)